MNSIRILFFLVRWKFVDSHYHWPNNDFNFVICLIFRRAIKSTITVCWTSSLSSLIVNVVITTNYVICMSMSMKINSILRLLCFFSIKPHANEKMHVSFFFSHVKSVLMWFKYLYVGVKNIFETFSNFAHKYALSNFKMND